MKEVIHLLMKRLLKNKYILLLPLVISLFILTLLIINSTQSGATQQELQETFKDRKETLQILISTTLTKERMVGLTLEEQQALESLLLKEQYVKEILDKLKEGNLQIASEQLAYIQQYEKYVELKPIPYLNISRLKIEERKAQTLLEQHLPYSEERTPFHTALFTKQLFQILFSPFTAFFFVLIFCYIYTFDRGNRAFDFLKINSLSNGAIYYGYMLTFILMVLLYIVLVCCLAMLPPLLMGNSATLFYPLEVAVNTEIVWVPVWKWLVFIPIGWGLFIVLLLLILTCLFKQQATLGILFTCVSLPVLISYIILLKAGFHVANPIHLLISYETDLLATNRYITYFFTMFCLLILGFIMSYIVMRAQTVRFRLHGFHFRKKQYQATGRFKLLQFEQLKKKRSGQILITLTLLFVSFGGTVAIVQQQFQTLPEKALTAIENYQNMMLKNQTHWELVAEQFEIEKEMQRLKDGTELDNGDVYGYGNIVKQLRDNYQVLESLKDEFHSIDFLEIYRETMHSLYPESYKEMNTSLWTVTTMASEEQRYLLDEKGIKPWSIGNMWTSKFSYPNKADSNDYKEILQEAQERNTKYDNSSLFAVYRFFDWNVMFFVLFIFVLLLWTTVAEERKVTTTIDFLVTKPIRYTSIYVTKWVYNLMIAYSLFLFSGGLIFLIATLIGGLGEAEYPILIYATERLEEHYFVSFSDDAYFYFENLATLLVKGGLLIVAQIFFLNSLFSFIGNLLKSHYAAIVVTCIIVIAGYALGNHYITMASSVYNPFIYLDTWNIVDGWKSIEADNGYVNVRNGVLLFFISGSLLFGLGFLGKRKVTRRQYFKLKKA